MSARRPVCAIEVYWLPASELTGIRVKYDKGSEFTASDFAASCGRLGVTQSMGAVGSCFDTAVIESWHSTLEFELLSRHRFATKAEARRAVARYMDTYNTTRRSQQLQDAPASRLRSRTGRMRSKAADEADAA